MEESLYQSRNFAQSFHCTSQYFHDGLCLHGTMVLQGGKKLAMWEIIVSCRLDSMLNSFYCLARLWPYYCLNCTGAINCTHDTIMAHIPISIQLSSCYTVPIYFSASYFIATTSTFTPASCSTVITCCYFPVSQ